MLGGCRHLAGAQINADYQEIPYYRLLGAGVKVLEQMDHGAFCLDRLQTYFSCSSKKGTITIIECTILFSQFIATDTALRKLGTLA